MVKYEDECCDCAVPAYPCSGSRCPLKKVSHYYCDECEDECGLYDFDGEELCLNCIESRLDKVEGSWN